MNLAPEKAIFAAGCFWGPEEDFRTMDGVIATRVGYIGGDTVNPTDDQVSEGTTGHAEAVEITFDPDIVTYGELLLKFWEIHDPTTVNRQGVNVGTEDRSAIFYTSKEQQEEAEESKRNLDASGKYPKPAVTDIVKATEFYPAAEYHQKYVLKTGRRV